MATQMQLGNWASETPEADILSGELTELSRDECLDLLRSAGVGRFAVCADGEAPLVVPVNFTLDGDDIVFRSDPGSKIEGFENRPASFEVDEIDTSVQCGWSVLIQGYAFVLPPWAGPPVEVHPWAGEKDLWVRLKAESVTGRRLVRPGSDSVRPDS